VLLQHARRIVLSGVVQGVGFRPFIYRHAQTHKLQGWVRNASGRVEVHVQGELQQLDEFIGTLIDSAPKLSRPVLESATETTAFDTGEFEILPSLADADADIHLPADLFTCDDCLEELNDPQDRRYRYPFINCTQCGPRYTLIESLPYDRPNTSMSAFPLCEACYAEYTDPANRRYHAEPVACAGCGPGLSYSEPGQDLVCGNEAALKLALTALAAGKVLAIKGIGGYHLVCDARNNQAVGQLRKNKPRPHKPLAVMFPAPPGNSLAVVRQYLQPNKTEAQLLKSPARPIVLVQKKRHRHPDQNRHRHLDQKRHRHGPGQPLDRFPVSPPPRESGDLHPSTIISTKENQKNSAPHLSPAIAPGLNEVGAMLPYSPLHHTLLNDFGAPLVASSANISGEPVLTQNEDIEQRLAHVANAFLHHDRPIVRPADDPVFRVINAQPMPIRQGRGLAPVELELPFELESPLLAVGAHMKNTVALAWENRVVVSPHIGEMDSPRSLQTFGQCISDLQALYQVKAEHIICDAHPGYTPSRWAHRQSQSVHDVYHHHAHASAVYSEAALKDKSPGDMLVFTWDGVGLGPDGTLWGGEALLGQPGQWQRKASFRAFRLPGGERAGREPWRSAAAICWEAGLECELQEPSDPLLHSFWQKGTNAPLTTAAGRLFDAAAALCGVVSQTSFEGQGPMQLEALASQKRHRHPDQKRHRHPDQKRHRHPDQKRHRHPRESGDLHPFTIMPISAPSSTNSGIHITDWSPIIPILTDTSFNPATRATHFHQSMAHALLQQAIQIRKDSSINKIGLAGGVFQNRVLTERSITLLQENGFEVTLPLLMPVNDAAISFGQIVEYGYNRKNRE